MFTGKVLHVNNFNHLHSVVVATYCTVQVPMSPTARDLPADLVLGVDFLKKAQIRVSFPDSAITLASGTQEVKVAFLTSREMTQHQRRPSNTSGASTNKTRAYSSNY